jgi:hypothetical protein
MAWRVVLALAGNVTVALAGFGSAPGMAAGQG